MLEKFKQYLDKFGLGTLFAANVLGAGSVYILSQTGASTKFGLLWVLPLAFGVDMLMHDMSGRLASNDRPLMEYIRSKIGSTPAKVYALSMAAVMQLWAVANYAVAGALLAHFISPIPVALAIVGMGSIGATLVSYGHYNSIEAVITALMFTVFGGYTLFAAGLTPPADQILAGLIPAFKHSPALVIAILGTTVYYPNFFIHSSIKPTKQWDSLQKYRLDNGVGIAISVIVSAAILIAGAMVLPTGEVSLLTPALPVSQYFGDIAYNAFLVVIMAAAFTSATGTLFGSGFAVPQAFGRKTKFGDKAFSRTVVSLIFVSVVLAIIGLKATAMTPARMAISMPAINGAIFLPITIFAMLAATWDELGNKQKIATIAATLVLLGGSILTAQSLYTMVAGWI